MKKEDCIFCKLAGGDIPVEALYEDDVVKVIFDAFPASKGHVLIIPKEHYANIYELTPECAGHIFQVAAKVASAMKEALDFEALNVVQNNGELAGQTVFHFHMHLIPRYKDDTIDVKWIPKEADKEEIKQLREIIGSKLQ